MKASLSSVLESICHIWVGRVLFRKVGAQVGSQIKELVPYKGASGMYVTLSRQILSTWDEF